MFEIKKITPAIGAVLTGIDFSKPITAELNAAIYQALIDHLVIFIRSTELLPAAHLDFASGFGQLDVPHPLYPHVDGYDRIMKLENDSGAPPDTNSWHTDLTYKTERPFASVLVARHVPEVGGDTMWSSCYAAYDRLPDGMKHDLEQLTVVHDFGDFRNNFADDLKDKSAAERLDEAVGQFGHCVKPLIGTHPVSGRKFLDFNEAFVTHIVGMTTNGSNALRTYLANHMNKPEDQMRWQWQAGDLAMWDNRVTMHYAVADYLPAYRCMHRVTVVHDLREMKTQDAA